MTAIHVAVTAEHIAAAFPRPPADLPKNFRDPIELAISDATGQAALCDGDGPDDEIATIGMGTTTLVISLPRVASAWSNRWYAGEPVEPFSFEIDVEPWLVDLVARRAA